MALVLSRQEKATCCTEGFRVPVSKEDVARELEDMARHGFVYNAFPKEGLQPADCDEIVQQTFVVVRARDPAKFSDLAHIRLFARKVAKNMWINHIKRVRWHVPLNSSEDSQELLSHQYAAAGWSAASPEEQLDKDQRCKALYEGLERLPRSLRVAIMHRYIDELEHAEIAVRSQLALSSVYSYLRSGLAQLKLHLRKLDLEQRLRRDRR